MAVQGVSFMKFQSARVSAKSATMMMHAIHPNLCRSLILATLLL